jgi:hypothetical protein
MATAAGCTSSGKTQSGNTPSGHVTTKYLTVFNNTSATVTMKACTGGTRRARKCSDPATVAPTSSAEFPLPPLNLSTPVSYVLISGYGKQPECLVIPPSSFDRLALDYVTHAQRDLCNGPHHSVPTP